MSPIQKRQGKVEIDIVPRAQVHFQAVPLHNHITHYPEICFEQQKTA